MSDPFVAEIRMFGGNFAPTGWAQCNGQLLPISQNTALFSLLGTFYGGDGKSHLRAAESPGLLPDRAGTGRRPERSLPRRGVGSRRTSRCSQSEMPAHAHTLNAYSDDPADINTPSPNVILGATAGLNLTARPSNTTLNAMALVSAGGSMSAQQPAAVPGRQLHHRDAGHLPAARLESEDAESQRRGGVTVDISSPLFPHVDDDVGFRHAQFDCLPPRPSTRTCRSCVISTARRAKSEMQLVPWTPEQKAAVPRHAVHGAEDALRGVLPGLRVPGDRDGQDVRSDGSTSTAATMTFGSRTSRCCRSSAAAASGGC